MGRRHDEGVILVYDGQCGFCIRSARWIEARLPADVRVEPWQSLDLDELGLSAHEAQAAVRCGGSRTLATSRGAPGAPKPSACPSSQPAVSGRRQDS